jgi:mannitol/fructose-specific phosphotransferase system IIA component
MNIQETIVIPVGCIEAREDIQKHDITVSGCSRAIELDEQGNAIPAAVAR